MNIGKMRHRITFQKPLADKDNLGAYEADWSNDDDWSDVASTWAQITPVSGREYLTQMRETFVSHKIYCRYRPGITPRLRIKFGDRYFRIISVLNWEERNEGLTIMCEEHVQ